MKRGHPQPRLWVRRQSKSRRGIVGGSRSLWCLWTWLPLGFCLDDFAASGLRGLDFLECEGDAFDPRWATLKSRLRRQSSAGQLRRGQALSEGVVELASDLLDEVEAMDWGAAVSAFGARLRGEFGGTEGLSGFCLYGAMTAYAAVAVHLDKHLGGRDLHLEPTAKGSVARALILLAKKQVNDYLTSSKWPLESLELVAMLESEDANAVRSLPQSFVMPCHMQLTCRQTLVDAEARISPPLHPLPTNWPSEVTAVGLHTTSTMEAVTALKDALVESWGRGGAAAAPFRVSYAGHPCPKHEGSTHHCAMRCDLFGSCEKEAAAVDPLADFLAETIDVGKFRERQFYTMTEAREAIRRTPANLQPIANADLVICTFPTILCVLLHELFPALPILFVAIASPLFAAPGCSVQTDTTVMDCETEEAQEFLIALGDMLSDPGNFVRGVAAYTITRALLGYQAGVSIPLAGKAGRYLPASATWLPTRGAEVLVGRSRLSETSFDPQFRTLFREFAEANQIPLVPVFQQDLGSYVAYEELCRFRAVIIVAQDLGLHKFTEHYAMAMPIWVPARSWAYRLQMLIPWGMVSYSGNWRGKDVTKERDLPPRGHPLRFAPPSEDWPEREAPQLVHPPYFNAQAVPYPLAEAAYWYEFSEFVSYPAVQHFSSIPELIIELAAADLYQIHSDMRKFRAELWRTTRSVYAAAASEIVASLGATMLAAER